ncbi:MAG TPA: hypothetical protein ENJ95_15050, partial [Bacteroidetes bacterium]|nr:hypothetical protein [Bacteroidota bacterium]
MKKITCLLTSLVFAGLLLSTSALRAQASQNVIDDLIEFAVLTDGANWYTPWPIDFSQNPPVPLSDACGWDGVTCNAAKDEIIAIALDSNGISGNLPPFCSFHSNPGSITSIKLSKNNLTGPLPDMSCLSSMKIMNLDSNSLTGQLDPVLATLPLLSFLDLSHNQFVGDIPAFPNKSNVFIKLSYNDLTSIPPSWNVFRRDISYNRVKLDAFPTTCDIESPINKCRPSKPFLLTRQGNTLSAIAAADSVAYITYVWINEGTGDTTTLTGTELFTVPETGSYHAVATLGGVSLGSESITVACPPGNIAYVNGQAMGNNDGTSWADAFTDLQDALALTGICPNITQIWVAAGTYYPTTGTDRTIPFIMKNGVGIYGGFVGMEGQLSQRDWAANVTTLSGDIGTQGDDSDNSYHVIFNNNGLNSTAVLDGFTVSGGKADGVGYLEDRGSGMFNLTSSPSVTNCSFSGNSANSSGGGMLNLFSSSPSVTNCSFSGNLGYQGGGMSNESTSSPSVTNCTFSGNTAVTFGGGMFNLVSSSPTVTNCTFSGNSAAAGGGMGNQTSASPAVTNCSFNGNTAGNEGGGMFNSFSSSPTVTNCTFS